MRLTHGLLTASLLFLLTGGSWAQARGGVDPKVAEPLIMSVLSKANLSGSLEYWGRCDDMRRFPDYPQIKALGDDTGQPVETLRKIFAQDSYMQVTQEPNGTIRMVETDVPHDLLDLPIRHISFDGSTLSRRLPDGTEKIEPWVLRDSNTAFPRFRWGRAAHLRGSG
jgi:hypothetical protein